MSHFILYDYLQVSGGAERLSIELARGLPGYRLVVSRIFEHAQYLMPEQALGADGLQCLGTGWSKPLRRSAEAAATFMLRTGFLRDAKSVVYSGLYAPFAVFQQQAGRRVYYCHSPPRYAYDWHDKYLSRMRPAIRPIARLMIAALRQRYEASLARMDNIVANSQNVRQRLQRHLGLDAEVIYPPVDTERFRWNEQGNYFLSLARLEPHKRVDLVIAAFKSMPDQRLVIASGGADEARLKSMAAGASNIHFTGWQSELQLQQWIGGARAAIYVPTDEDFGMSPVEAMAAGKPVIGVSEGGMLETVVQGETGILVAPERIAEGVIDAVGILGPARALAMRAACEERASYFSRRLFLQRMERAIGI